MHNNDQLTRNERIRLESLNQAVVFCMHRNVQGEEIVAFARKFEEFIHAADTDYKTQ